MSGGLLCSWLLLRVNHHVHSTVRSRCPGFSCTSCYGLLVNISNIIPADHEQMMKQNLQLKCFFFAILLDKKPEGSWHFILFTFYISNLFWWLQVAFEFLIEVQCTRIQTLTSIILQVDLFQVRLISLSYKRRTHSSTVPTDRLWFRGCSQG